MPDRSPSRFKRGRHAGVIVPLFSIPSRQSWGIGEIPDLPRLARWLETAGLDFVQVLPVNEMQEGQSSPYAALSAMAIDPIFIAVEEVPEFRAAGGQDALGADDRERIDAARRAPRVDYTAVRDAKRHALAAAFEAFRAGTARTDPRRQDAFAQYIARERWWLEDYALFRALHEEHQGRYWREWEAPLRDREPQALSDARRRLDGKIEYYQYLQWIADEQWHRTREACGSLGIFGDFPFMVSGHSADVWARQDEFRHDVSVGVPPDAFSETGQDWGLPLYLWHVIEPRGYEWLTQRAKRCADLFDALRIDHLVGFYRTYARERDGSAAFHPPDEPSQTAQGERLMDLFARAGPRIIAEDLGVIPDFVRESLARLDVPGLKVLRWERDWHAEGQPFLDPAAYPACSVAISGTHDTETLAEWWDSAPVEEREAVAAIPALRDRSCNPLEPYCDSIRDAFIATLFLAGSDLVLLPIQDVFGWRDRINTPASVSEENWSWRLPWPVEDLMKESPAQERAQFLRALAGETGRT